MSPGQCPEDVNKCVKERTKGKRKNEEEVEREKRRRREKERRGMGKGERSFIFKFISFSRRLKKNNIIKQKLECELIC